VLHTGHVKCRTKQGQSNEKFSGKGHARHICKDRAKEQKHLAKLQRNGMAVEPTVLPPPPPDDLIYHLDDRDDDVFDPDEFYWTQIRPFED